GSARLVTSRARAPARSASTSTPERCGCTIRTVDSKAQLRGDRRFLSVSLVIVRTCFRIRVGGDTIEARLTALDTAVDGPLGDEPTGRSRDDLVEFFHRFETVLRGAAAIGHRLIVETTERRVPGHLGCRSVGDFLSGTLRISGADATRRVKGAKKAG